MNYDYNLSKEENADILFGLARSYKLEELDPETYWDFVSKVWIQNEFQHADVDDWWFVFSQSPGPNARTREWLKSPCLLYRGIDGNHIDQDCDWSWTTDPDQAEWFAKRFDWHAPAMKVFDPSKDPSRVWCVTDSTENEVILWSPTAYEMVCENEQF